MRNTLEKIKTTNSKIKLVLENNLIMTSKFGEVSTHLFEVDALIKTQKNKVYLFFKEIPTSHINPTKKLIQTKFNLAKEWDLLELNEILDYVSDAIDLEIGNEFLQPKLKLTKE